MVKQTRKKQKGSGFVRKGTYGCAYRPALFCEGNTERKKDAISKLMFEYQADLEYKSYDLLKPIDPDRQYFIYPNRICRPNVSKVDPSINNISDATCTLLRPGPIQRNTNLSHETNITDDLHNAKLVEYPDGGEDLEHFVPRQNNYYEYFRGFANLLEGLVKLHAAGLYHLDIKPYNIVAQRGRMSYSGEQEIKMRFIDFGFLCSAETYHDTLTSGQITSGYQYWPYDIYFTTISPFNTTLLEDPKYFDTFFSNYYQTLKHHLAQLPGRFLYTLKNLKKKLIVEVLYENYRKFGTSSSDLGSLKQLLPKVDVYMLGVTMMILYRRFLLQHESFTMKSSGPVNRIETSKRIPANNAWFKVVANQISYPFCTLIKKMLFADFTQRLTAQQALDEYKPILAKIKEIVTEQAVKDNIVPYLSDIKAPNARPTQPSPSFNVSPTPSPSPRSISSLAENVYVSPPASSPLANTPKEIQEFRSIKPPVYPRKGGKTYRKKKSFY